MCDGGLVVVFVVVVVVLMGSENVMEMGSIVRFVFDVEYVLFIV